MDDRIREALALTPSSTARDRTVDITTIGARSGEPRRIEIWFYRVDDEIYLTGSPGRRDWHANLLANPRFTFHLKHGVTADLAATASPVDEEQRRRVLTRIVEDLNQPSNPARIRQPVPLERWLEGSPVLRVDFDEPTGAQAR